ncbi:Alpha mannosidase, middle domain [Tyrophagus putrescentiae]|nr:Alpha mannosidase, middle domain [Tyrophagus putrescentiae]
MAQFMLEDDPYYPPNNFRQANHLQLNTQNAQNIPPALPPRPTINSRVPRPSINQRQMCEAINAMSIPKVNNYIREEIARTKKLGLVNETVEKVKAVQKTKKVSKTKRNAVIIGLVSVLGFLFYEPGLDFILDYNLQLKPGGITTAAWKVNPIPLLACFHLYGITNGRRFLQGEKPVLVDHGPFCYNIKRQRKVLEWKEKSVVYSERYAFTANQASSAPLDTPITMVNLPIFAGVMAARGILEANYVGFLGFAVYNAMTHALTLSGEQLIETITARQLMEKRKLPILQYLDLFLAPIRAVGVPVPDFHKGFMGISNHAFGIATSGGAFEIGPYEAWRRSEDGHVAGHIFKYGDGITEYSQFKAPCNRLGGSEAIFFRRPQQEKFVYLYMAHQLCRVLRFDYNRTEFYAGAVVRRYLLDPQMNNYRLKRNQCFCSGVGKRWQDCDGFTDLSPCLFGVPVGISFPHFLHSPRRLAEIGGGLEPTFTEHQSYLLLEPNLGVPVYAKVAIQPVLGVSRIGSVLALSRLPTVRLPLMWINIEAGADNVPMKIGLFVASNGIRYGSYGFLLGGLGLLGLVLGRASYRKYRENRKQTEIEMKEKSGDDNGYIVLSVVEAVVIQVEDLPERCDFRKCTAPDPSKLNVHLVPHTHDDVGWLKTVDEYFFGLNVSIQNAGVQYILDSVVSELIKNKERRFIYVETAFFWKWWRLQSEHQREIVKELVKTGQLEFIGGGWSMNDEATSHYSAIVDQMTWGHRRLRDTFGRCGVPKVAWQIDPFGHSKEQANLFAAMNFDALFFAREDYQDRAKRAASKTLEHVWQASQDLGKAGDLFTGMMYMGYGPPSKFNWDLIAMSNQDTPVVDDPDSEEYNVPAIVEKFTASAKGLRRPLRHQFDSLSNGHRLSVPSRRNLVLEPRSPDQALENSPDIKVFYSTPSCYAKALHDTKRKWTSKTDDYFPYANAEHSYWTGYFHL